MRGNQTIQGYIILYKIIIKILKNEGTSVENTFSDSYLINLSNMGIKLIKNTKKI